MIGETLRAFHYHDDEPVAMILLGQDPVEVAFMPPGVDTLDLYGCPHCGEQVSIAAVRALVEPTGTDRGRP